MRIFSPFKGINTLFKAGKCWVFVNGVIIGWNPEILIGFRGCQKKKMQLNCQRWLFAQFRNNSASERTEADLLEQHERHSCAKKRRQWLNFQGRGHFWGCGGQDWSHVQSHHCGAIWGSAVWIGILVNSISELYDLSGLLNLPAIENSSFKSPQGGGGGDKRRRYWPWWLETSGRTFSRPWGPFPDFVFCPCFDFLLHCLRHAK